MAIRVISWCKGKKLSGNQWLTLTVKLIIFRTGKGQFSFQSQSLQSVVLNSLHFCARITSIYAPKRYPVHLTPTPTRLLDRDPRRPTFSRILTTFFYFSSSSHPLPWKEWHRIYTSQCGCEGYWNYYKKSTGKLSRSCSGGNQPFLSLPAGFWPRIRTSPTPRRLTPRPMGGELEHEPASERRARARATTEGGTSKRVCAGRCT